MRISDCSSDVCSSDLVGVPMIDGDPVEPGAEIARHVVHQFAGERLEVGHLACVLGRDDEAEMMPVVLAALREGIAIGVVRAGIEKAGVASIARYAAAI